MIRKGKPLSAGRPVRAVSESVPRGRIPSNQRGAVLVMSLIILLILTVLGLTAMQTTGVQERMAGGLRDASISLQAAEAALRDGERLIEQEQMYFLEADYYYRFGDEDSWDFTDFSSVTTRTYQGGQQDFDDLLDEPPEYFIVEMDPALLGGGAPRDTELEFGASGDDVRAFRVIARSTGASGNTETVLESVYVVAVGN